MINQVIDQSNTYVKDKAFNRVHEQPIYTKNKAIDLEGINCDYDQLIQTHKSICNDKNRVIAIVGKGYKLVQNAEIIPDFESAIYRSNLDTTSMTREIKQSHSGARIVCTYIFPAHTIEITPGDSVALKISILNSYDGSWKFTSILGALRFACKNGLVIGNYYSSFYGKHTKGLDTDIAIKQLEDFLDVFLNNAQAWKQYPSISVSKLQANEVFKSLAGESEKLLELLQSTHALYTQSIGNNLWALFNTVTDWSSHAKFRNIQNIASTVIAREKRVRKILPMIEKIRQSVKD